ncbi:MAG: hypothetical protein MUP36_02870 [Demequinaceae bacterium]|nr:hypothetical protein [Demequinaceae bacterium]
MSYAIDPTWTNLLSPGDQDFIHEWYSDFPNAKSEYSGAWLMKSPGSDGEGVLLYIVSFTDGQSPGLARNLARGYIDSELYKNFQISLEKEYTNGRGYPGWRIDYTGDYLGLPYSESVLALKAGTSVIYVYGTSEEGFESLIPQMLSVADSIVVHHPPAES